MVTIQDKITLINLSVYAEKVAATCEFYEILKPLNKTTYWISIHGSLYENWIDPNSQDEPEDLIKDSDDLFRKHIIRELALKIGVPEISANKRKKALQYGSLIHKALIKSR